jgi:hypothetical protein
MAGTAHHSGVITPFPGDHTWAAACAHEGAIDGKLRMQDTMGSRNKKKKHKIK